MIAKVVQYTSEVKNEAVLKDIKSDYMLLLILSPYNS